MSRPIPNADFVKIFQDEGIKVMTRRGWQNHNRGNRGTGWGPINWIVNHHTGSNTSGSGHGYNEAVLWPGYAGLPGPLCHGGIGPDGTLWINSNGRANHAGLGDSSVANAVIGEANWLMQREAKPRRGNMDGNSRSYGFEIMYSGSKKMTRAQRKTAIHANIAIARYYSWSGRSSIGHREWSTTKWDPGHCPMVPFRKEIDKGLGKKPTKVKHKKKKSKPKSTAKMNPRSYYMGARGPQVKWLGERLVAHGFSRHYKIGPGPLFTGADKANLVDFQKAQGWKGSGADGYPGPLTLKLLAAAPHRKKKKKKAKKKYLSVKLYPSKRHPRHGAYGAHITWLGQRLRAHGYTKHYRVGPGPRWTNADRLNVRDMQLAQGWRGSDADGYPGPETLRRLAK